MTTLEEKGQELAVLSRRIHKLKVKLTYLEEERRKTKLEYESLDRRQAMVDGRCKNIKVKPNNHKPKKEEKELTKDDIYRLADKLGINLKRWGDTRNSNFISNLVCCQSYKKYIKLSIDNILKLVLDFNHKMAIMPKKTY